MTALMVSTESQARNVPLSGDKMRVDYKVDVKLTAKQRRSSKGLMLRAGKTKRDYYTRVTCDVTGKRKLVMLGNANQTPLAEVLDKLEQIKVNGLSAFLSASEAPQQSSYVYTDTGRVTGSQVKERLAKLATESPNIDKHTDIVSAHIDAYIRLEVLTAKHPHRIAQILWNDVLPFLANKTAEEVTLLDAKAHALMIADTRGPSPARGFAVYLLAYMKWLDRHDICYSRLSTKRLTDFKLEQAKSRSRTLRRDEVRPFFEALDNARPMNEVTRLGLKILFYTSARGGELLAAKWSDVHLDGDKPYWHQPDNKAARPIDIPLAPQSVALFLRLRKLTGKTGMVLGGASSGIFTKAMGRLQQRGLLELDQPLRVHDLRRTGRTFMSLLGVPSDIAERALNHAVGGLIEVYDQHDFMAERREAACLLADALDDPMGKLPDIEMRRQ